MKSGNQKAEKVTMKLNFAAITYYKGTGLEGATNSLEQYIDNADSNESDINII